MSVAPEHIQTVKQALDRSDFYSQKDLADKLQLSRSTISNFLNGKPVNPLNFDEISESLNLDWKEIAADDRLPPPPVPPNIDTLVREVRRCCQTKIQTLYGKMQLLDIAQPIDVDNLYVDVNILEQISSQRWVEISDLVDDRGYQKRIPGLEAVERYNRLMVLGKPGSGKTTFLQHLTIQCNQGSFQADRVPIFIRLRNFAKYVRNEADFKLLNYISQEFSSCGILPKDTELILKEGRGLVLLDGLDEVTAKDESRVTWAIEQFANDFYKNQLVVTCRIAASQYNRFTAFTEVEVADFNLPQIEAFAAKWFIAVAENEPQTGLATAKRFIEQLNRRENRRIRELAVTPILLHLTCLVFQAQAEFPSNRAKLYEQGLDILLERWDESRKIKRDEIYRDLFLEDKKDLLIQVAFVTFEQGDYFFERDTIQKLIADYLCTLIDTQTKIKNWKRDSRVVLKSIEAQHGLLIERARNIYSFSHLTFQEYFAAKAIADRSDSKALERLVSHITERRWREVFLLAVEMCKSADCLLQFMKQQADNHLATDRKLQRYLKWVNQKSLSVEVPYRLASVRALYFSLSFNLDFNLALDLDANLDSDIARDLFNLDLDLDLKLVRDFNPELNLDLNRARELNRTLSLISDHELKRKLQLLKNQLPHREASTADRQKWWEAHGKAWTEELRAVMIQHRNIGHDWQFSKPQKERLKQYYDANQLLVDCLNSTCHVTPAVRQEIENTLLLPIAEIEKKQSG